MATEQVPLSSLSAQQLLEVRQNLEQEVQSMAQNGLTLQSTAAKFGAAGQAVEYLQDQKQGEHCVGPCSKVLKRYPDTGQGRRVITWTLEHVEVQCTTAVSLPADCRYRRHTTPAACLPACAICRPAGAAATDRVAVCVRNARERGDGSAGGWHGLLCGGALLGRAGAGVAWGGVGWRAVVG